MTKYPDHPLATEENQRFGDELLRLLRTQGPSESITPTHAIVSLRESPNYPGFVDIDTIGAHGAVSTRHPIAPWAVDFQLKALCGASLRELEIRPRFGWSVPRGKDKQPQRAPVVYFVQAKDGGPIKIGKANNINERLASLQVGNSSELICLATMPGGLKEERRLHRRFRRFLVRGEWFADCPEIRAEIERARERSL